MVIIPVKGKDIIHRRELCCIRGLLEVISFINGTSYCVESKPDFDNHTTKACDVTAIVGKNKFAIEHTRITSTPDQISDYELKQKFFTPLFSELQKELPPGYYTFIIDCVTKGKKEEWDTWRNEIKKFCIGMVYELESDEDHPQKSVKFVSDIVPFQVTILRMKSENNDVKFIISRWHHPDKLSDVLQKCLSDFEPKMSKYKLDGYQTILLLESEISDIHTLSSNDINEVFLSIKENLTVSQVPDHIYLIQTGFQDWSVIQLNINYKGLKIIARWNPYEKKVIL